MTPQGPREMGSPARWVRGSSFETSSPPARAASRCRSRAGCKLRAPTGEASRVLPRADTFSRQSKATTLCASGYVSGTILHLKQGTDPHPQGIARRGRGCGGWLQAVRFCFIWPNWRNSRNLNLHEGASHRVLRAEDQRSDPQLGSAADRWPEQTVWSALSRRPSSHPNREGTRPRPTG